MQMLNRYFTPFALVLIVSALYFRFDDFRDPGARAPMLVAAGIVFADVLVNWWLGRNQYRWIKWSRQLRLVQVWLPFIWAVPLFYLLYPYWAPMWLLFVMAPTAAAMTTSRGHTVLCAFASIATMFGIYWSKQPLEGVFLGMALCQAAFILIFALFVNSLAQAALRMRDASLT
ncbi:MAG TPA: hypothetical protein VH309_05615 [Elusimicrobiota bacterium]|jgi:hypothetical protein|nr:hypothetical protein [Elusimicrobiota bacterium]